MHLYVFDILGLRDDLAGDNNRLLGQLIDTVLDIRMPGEECQGLGHFRPHPGFAHVSRREGQGP